MDTLESKYKNNNLTNEELLDLRKAINSMSDSEITSSLKNSWDNYIPSGILVPDRCHKNIKQITHSQPLHKKPTIFKRISQIAAIILIPLFISTTLYFYHRTKEINYNITTITTGIGEKASISLPDGTKVIVNSESTLSYAPNTFNKSERIVKFEGEAYFNVERDSTAPFIIRTRDAQVNVLGTIFNLCARERDKIIELELEQGSVMMTSIKSKEECIISPNTIARLDKLTGKITLTSTASDIIISNWRNNELNFKNATLDDILKVIESTYGVEITITREIKTLKDLFTGTIPSNNLSEAMEVLEKSHRIKTKIVDKQISITE